MPSTVVVRSGPGCPGWQLPRGRNSTCSKASTLARTSSRRPRRPQGAVHTGPGSRRRARRRASATVPIRAATRPFSYTHVRADLRNNTERTVERGVPGRPWCRPRGRPDTDDTPPGTDRFRFSHPCVATFGRRNEWSSYGGEWRSRRTPTSRSLFHSLTPTKGSLTPTKGPLNRTG